MLVRLAPSVPAAGAPLLPSADEIPHVVGEDTVLDQHVALRRRAFVVDRVRAPFARVRAVIDQGDERRRDQLADPAAEHRCVLLHQVRFESVSARLVEEHPTRAALQHHGQLPAGSRTGVEHRERARRAAICATDSGSISSKISKPIVRPGASYPVCIPVSPTATQFTPKRVRTAVVLDEQAVGVGDEHAATGVGIGRAHLADRVALGARGLVGALEHLGLPRLLHRLGEDAHLVGRGHRTPLERHHVGRAGGAAGGGRRRLGGGAQPGVAEVGGVRVAGGVAPHDADAGAPLAAGDQFLDLGVVEAGGRDPAVLREHLGEVATVVEGGLERALEHGFVDHDGLS